VTVREILDAAAKLPRAHQIELWDELICLVGDAESDVALTPAQAEDLDRRMEEAAEGRARLIPGDEAIAQLVRPEVQMETVHGTIPADRSQRDISMWFDEAEQLNLWIHPPNSGNDAGWQVKVSREDFEAALRSLRIPRD
jgi:hypothetical protein